MSGDWIKLEHATLNKPEVLRLARMWGVTKDHALGVVIRFWVWADNASVDGLVDGVASHELDAMMLMPGFAQGMVAVRWLDITEEPPCISIPHFSEHNGETSKKRALRNKRQAHWRSTNVDTDVDGRVDTSISHTRLPEKRREEKRRDKTIQETGRADALPSPKLRPKITATRLQEDWRLPDGWREWAELVRPDWTPQQVVLCSLTFRDYWLGKAGKDGLKANWLATWRNWVRREDKEPVR